MRQYACGHADVGERLRHCDFRRLHNKECNSFALAPEDTTVETEQCAFCRECVTSVGVHDQDSAHSNAVSPPILVFEGRRRSSVEQNSKPLPRLIGERDVPGEGPTLFYEDGTTCKKALINAHWSVKEALAPHKRLAMGCPHCQNRKIICDLGKPKCGNCSRIRRDCWLPTTGPRNLGDGSVKLTEEMEQSRRLVVACTICREKKTKCDPAEPKCIQCAKYGRDCRWPTSGPRNLGDGSLKLTEEAQKPEEARFFNSEQSLNDKDPRRPLLKGPSLSASPETSKTTTARTRPVPILAHNLVMSPQSRKHLPEWVPQQTKHGQLTDGSLSAAVLQPLRTYGTTPLHTLLAKYYLLDTISKVKIENVKSCLDAVHAERPIRPLAESVALLYAKPPKVWLAIRRMIRNPYFDNLYVLDIIFDAKLYTDYVLSHKPSRPTLGPIEQMFAGPALFDCIRVRQYMLNMLFREIQVLILEVEISGKIHSDARFPSDHHPPAKSLPAEGRNQAAQTRKRWLQISSQRIWDRILHPTVEGKPRTRSGDAPS